MIKTLEGNTIKAEYVKYDKRNSLLIIKDKNYDSISVLLNSIGGLGTAWGIDINLPTVEEFIDLDLVNKIDDDSIRFYFKNCFLICI